MKLTAGRKVARSGYNTRKMKTSKRENKKWGRKHIGFDTGKLKRGPLTEKIGQKFVKKT